MFSLDPSKLSGMTSSELFVLLLPGFLSYAIFHAIALRGTKVEATNSVLNALSLTLVVQVVWYLLKQLGTCFPTSDLVGLTATALVSGLALVKVEESGFLHTFLRKIHLTSASQWSTVWRTSFMTYRDKCDGWVVVYFKDGRRLQGSVIGLPSDTGDDFLCLVKTRWLTIDEKSTVENPGVMLVAVPEIKLVQFVSH